MKKCIHCEQDNPIKNSEFCCRGCEAANHIIKKSGLAKYYQNRIIDNNINSLIPDSNKVTEGISSFAKLNDDEYILYLMIDNIHCGSCVWLIEEMLKKQDKVTYARVNMSTRRLVLKWRGNQNYGDKLVNIINDLGYQASSYDPELLENCDILEQRTLLKYVAISGFAAANIMLFSVSLWSDSNNSMGLNTKYFFHIISMIIALPVILYTGQVFFKSAFAALKNKKTNMDVPISLAVILTTIMSILEAINHGEYIYFESAVMLIFFLLIGRYLDKSAKRKARSTAGSLLIMMSGTASCLQKNGKYKIIPITNIKPDMIINVPSGARIPIDAEIIKGSTEIDNSIITGETIPERLNIGDKIFAGTINLGNAINVKALKNSDNNLINDIVNLIEQSEQHDNKFIRIADKAARLYTPIVHFLALITFLFWYLIMGEDWQHSLIISTTVLIITCPCALALAVPIVQVLAGNILMRKGIILKTGDALEKVTNIQDIFFDKTGTITMGKPLLINKVDEESLKLAASMACKSHHPLSIAICDSYKQELIDLKTVEIAGSGIKSEYNGQEIFLGNAEFCNIKGDNNLPDIIVYLKLGDNITEFKFRDKLRDNSENIIQELKTKKYNVEILSGDRKKSVQEIAVKIGIGKYQYKLSPIQKLEHLKKSEYSLMVGDGLNDAAALSSAYVSMSPASAIDITQNSADIIYQGKTLAPILDIINIAHKSMKIIKQNLTLAVIYNMIAIPIAVMGFASPIIAAIAMSSSSLIVVLNSLRLKRI